MSVEPYIKTTEEKEAEATEARHQKEAAEAERLAERQRRAAAERDELGAWPTVGVPAFGPGLTMCVCGCLCMHARVCSGRGDGGSAQAASQGRPCDFSEPRG
jgi:hypothetical protein